MQDKKTLDFDEFITFSKSVQQCLRNTHATESLNESFEK